MLCLKTQGSDPSDGGYINNLENENELEGNPSNYSLVMFNNDSNNGNPSNYPSVMCVSVEVVLPLVDELISCLVNAC